MELVFVRHGLPQRVDDAGGPADPPLSDEGQVQATGTAEWLAPTGIDAIYCSPMRRARETAEPLASVCGCDVVVDEGLEEFDAHLHFYIPLEELTRDDPRWEQLVAEWSSPEADATRQSFRKRVVESVERIVSTHPSQRVALVCHGGVINAYLSHILDMERTLFFEPGYASVSRVLAASAGQRQLVSANESPPTRAGLLS
jgi:probable phosphoglycerate mutase